MTDRPAILLASKSRDTRKNPGKGVNTNGNFATAKKVFKEALDTCPVDVIRHFYRRTYWYMSVYRHGATGPLAEFAVKQYKSHRGITKADLAAAEEKKATEDKKVAVALQCLASK
jgi:hypothetical protein